MTTPSPTPLSTPVMRPYKPVAGDWSILPSWIPVPGMGTLAVNSFLLRGRQPLLVDTGLGTVGDAYMEALTDAIDPADLRWIWISHLDADHVGNLQRLLAQAPKATVVTGFLSAGKMGLAGIDVPRLQVIEPGTQLDLGDRSLIPLRPPYYDAPETLGFLDPRDRVLFAVDSFGAVLPAPVESDADVPSTVLAEGLHAWSSLDAPWLSLVDTDRFAGDLAAIDRLDPAATLCGHLPPFRRGVQALTRHVRDSWCNPHRDQSPPPFSLESLLAAAA